MKKAIIEKIIENNNMNTTGIEINVDDIHLSERSIAVCAMRLEGKTYREIGEALGVSKSRADQLEKQAVYYVRRYIDTEVKKKEKAAAEKAAAEKKNERLEKVVPGKPGTWELLSIYDLDPSVRLVNVLARWFGYRAEEITVGMIVDAIEDPDDFYPLGLKVRGMGLTTWKELLVSLDQLMKNDEDSSLFKKYYNVK